MAPYYYETLKKFGVNPPPIEYTPPKGGYDPEPRRPHCNCAHQVPQEYPISYPEARQRASEIAADFCSLVKIRQGKASSSVLTKEDEQESTISAQNDSEEALLERLHSNWEALRELRYKEKPKIEFLLIASWLLEGDTVPSTEPLQLLEQIIRVQNSRVRKWIKQREEWNNIYANSQPNPDAEDDKIPDNKPIYYKEYSSRRQRPFDPASVDLPSEQEILKHFRLRSAIIEDLNNDHLYWEDYEKNVYPGIWRARIEKAGGYYQTWKNMLDEWARWIRHLKDQELKGRRDRYRYDLLSGAGHRRSLRIQMFGYPEELMTDEEKARRDGSVLRKVWSSLPDRVKKDGEKEE